MQSTLSIAREFVDVNQPQEHYQDEEEKGQANIPNEARRLLSRTNRGCVEDREISEADWKGRSDYYLTSFSAKTEEKLWEPQWRTILGVVVNSCGRLSQTAQTARFDRDRDR